MRRVKTSCCVCGGRELQRRAGRHGWIKTGRGFGGFLLPCRMKRLQWWLLGPVLGPLLGRGFGLDGPGIGVAFCQARGGFPKWEVGMVLVGGVWCFLVLEEEEEE